MNAQRNDSPIKDHNVEMGEALKALMKDRNFQLVILDGYLKEKVLASVSLLAVPDIKDKGQRPGVMEDLVSASNLSYFLQMVEMRYDGAVNPILSDDEELTENEAN